MAYTRDGSVATMIVCVVANAIAVAVATILLVLVYFNYVD
jgi:uncharacterized membrane protein YgaE (UPF0421/DUF939 family)